jgi:hypothetical protein
MDPGTLGPALAALDLDLSEHIITKRDDDHSPNTSVQSSQQAGIYMTATFAKTKRPQIERVLRHLSSLLIGSHVRFSDSGDGVRVSGDFEEHQKKEIQMTLDDLKALCITFHVTW